MRTNRQKHCSLWLCHTTGVLIHGLTNKSDTVVEFDSDRCFFLLWLPNFRKFCMSKHICSFVIIVPWNNIKKRILLSIFSMQRWLWRVCTFAQAYLSLRPGTEISCAGSNNDLCTVYNNSECCGEAAPATTVILCNHQCVVSMRQKMLPVRCNKNSSIKHLLVYQEKKQSYNRFFGCYFMGIWQQLRLDVQISLNFGSYTRKKHLSRQNSRTVLDLQPKPWIISPIAWQSHKLQCYR